MDIPSYSIEITTRFFFLLQFSQIISQVKADWLSLVAV